MLIMKLVSSASNPAFKINREILSKKIKTDDEKIIYNSRTRPKTFVQLMKQKRDFFRKASKKTFSNEPLSLKLIDDNFITVESNEDELDADRQLKKNVKPNLPYSYNLDYQVDSSESKIQQSKPSVQTGVNVESMLVDDAIKGARCWMNDYEKYCSSEDDVIENNEWLVNYGTADPDIPVTDVACGGCGAYLHCQEPSLPGYLPSEILTACKKQDLLGIFCQRCHFLKNYNTALSVQVNPERYVELIRKIKPKALVVLLVDLTDITGSIWPGISDILGKDRRIFLVGNKVDLLWGDRHGWLKHVESVLKRSVPYGTNILDACLISAKTGYGVEDLVTKLHEAWKGTDDVYLVGCTNVGKSTLFNALIQSDYCKTKAVDLVQRATTAPWPGTTLNLLKFPILRPSAWRLAARNARLNVERSRTRAETELRKLQIKMSKKRVMTPPQLIGNISHTFKDLSNGEENLQSTEDNLFSLPKNVKDSEIEDHRISLINSGIPEFEQGRWCFDTPGVLHRDQILDLLTAEELLLTIPKKLITPRTFLLYPGMTLFIACLARLDYTSGDRSIRVTVFSSGELPISICKAEDSDEVYSSLLGSELSLVPQGSVSRLKEWPGLTASEPFILCGVDRNESCADITFSSTGWMSVTPDKNEICKLVAWSPLGRGVSVRHPPILPFAVALRGKKLPRSPAYSSTKPYC